MQIPGRSLQVTMPHQNLDAAQVGCFFQQMGGEAVPQCVGRYRFGQMRSCTCLVADAPDGYLRDRTLGISDGEQPGLGSVTLSSRSEAPPATLVRASRGDLHGPFPDGRGLAGAGCRYP